MRVCVSRTVKNQVFSSNRFSLKQIACSEVQSVFSFQPHSASCVTSSLYLTIFSAETGTCGESVFMSWGVEKVEGDEEEGSREIIV